MVAGSARGRRLAAPPGTSTRPTSDRVREAVFNALHSLGAVEGATVVDLFAGSGAMGIEALSRGAHACTFVELDPRAVAVVKANLQATGLTGTVLRADATTVALPPADLALLDPPYAFADEAWRALLDRLEARAAVVESDREVPIGRGWEVLRVRRYGTTVVTIARQEGTAAP